MVRDKIVFGIGDKKVRERLIREAELTLEAAIKICHASEMSQKHLKTFSEMGVVNVREDVDVGAISKPDNARHSAHSRPKMDSFYCKNVAHSIHQGNVLPLVSNAVTARVRTILQNSVFQEEMRSRKGNLLMLWRTLI